MPGGLVEQSREAGVAIHWKNSDPQHDITSHAYCDSGSRLAEGDTFFRNRDSWRITTGSIHWHAFAKAFQKQNKAKRTILTKFI